MKDESLNITHNDITNTFRNQNVQLTVNYILSNPSASETELSERLRAMDTASKIEFSEKLLERLTETENMLRSAQEEGRGSKAWEFAEDQAQWIAIASGSALAACSVFAVINKVGELDSLQTRADRVIYSEKKMKWIKRGVVPAAIFATAFFAKNYFSYRVSLTEQNVSALRNEVHTTRRWVDYTVNSLKRDLVIQNNINVNN